MFVRRRLFVSAVIAALMVMNAPFARAAELDIQVPAPRVMDACPVCGMLVAKYREWVATVVYKDGHAHHFDGAKDMFKFLFDMAKYGDGHTPGDIERIGVTEYYDLRKIDAKGAFYVVGSDVTGPMGHELVPFASRADAEAFLADHRGVRVLEFPDVTAGLPAMLDRGVFE
ncbi:MAG: nitrous oxide reductase accessory protein NosL [Alphaproteobacteria bacterium]|nr:nitrous oxide reductase accessory protein NosL [Alphaproteobacteria bacterium]